MSSEAKSIFCEHIRVGDKPLFEDDDPTIDSSQVETAPAFQCGLSVQPCRYATRKNQCPTYQDYLVKLSSTN